MTDATCDDALAREVGAALDTLTRRASLPRVHQRLTATAGVSLDRSGYWLASWLAVTDGLRLSDLADLQRTDLSTVSRQIQASERAGLVERRPDPSDGRATLVHLTPHGRDVLERLRAVQRAEILAAVAGWPPEEQQAFARLLTRFASRLLDWAACDPTASGARSPRSCPRRYGNDE